MLGVPLFVATCIYYKQSKSKYSGTCKKHKKQSAQDDKQSKPFESNNSNETIRSNTKTNEKVIISLCDSTDYDNDSCYYIPGKKVFRVMDKIPKKKQQKSTDVESMHFPKKVFGPMLKISKLYESRRLRQTRGQVTSTFGRLSTLFRKCCAEKFHRTRTIGSIQEKSFTSTLALTSTKNTEPLTKITNVENLNSALTVSPGIGPVELGKDEVEYIDAENDLDYSRNIYTMKRGIRYLFNQERLINKDDNDDMEVEQKRGFFQKFFRPTSSRLVGSGEGTSIEPEGRPLLHDDDGYAVIDRRQDEFVISIDKDKREMSAPVSPKSVTFEDNLFTTITERRGQSVAPPSTFLNGSTRTTIPKQQAFINLDYDVSQISAMNYRHDLQSPRSRSTLSDREHYSPIRSSRDASLALDEATHDLLRFSSQPPSVWDSSSSHPLHTANRIPKSASTTSMNKTIRTKDEGMVKPSNVFSWDTDRLSDLRPSDTSTYTDEEGRRHQTVTVYTNKRRQGPPIVRTTVEGKLKMEKVVGADLISVEHCTCSAWTIRDTITHYKVKTTLGNRTLIMEELTNGENRERNFKMSLYEDGQLKTRDMADFQIPSNADKAKYLSLLSQRLLHDMETLNQQEERKIITRIEVEVIEDVTKILKTYIIGERNDLLQDFSVDQAAVDANNEFPHSIYEHEKCTSSHDLAEKEYMDVLEKEAITCQPSPDIKFIFEGHYYEDHSAIQSHQRTDSETMTTSESITKKYVPPPFIYINVECTLKRLEDHSLNEVNVAVPNVFSAVLSLIRERIPPQLPNLVSYGMEQHGKQYSGETTIRRLHRFESTESFDEMQKTMIHTQKEPSFLFEKPQIIEPVKIPVLNITELDLRRLADTSAILANFAIPRTDQNQLDIERRYEFREAQGSSYGAQQKGQHFEGETVLRKKRRLFFESESDSVSEEDICGPTYLNLTKQEARGEFEVAIIISNDQRSSPKHFQESQPIEVINLIAQISTDGKKEEILATFATKISCKEVYMGQEMSTVSSTAIITIQKTVSLDDIFQQNIRSWSDRRVERITASFSEFFEEQMQVFVNIGHVNKYSSELTVEFIVKDVRTQKTDLYSRASLESERVANVSLNRGSKMLTASTQLFERMKQNAQMTITEFGDEREQVAILLQRAGIMHGQVHREWPEAVTGRSRSTCNTFSTTKTFNIFEAFIDPFNTMTNTDFPSTDLTKINTATKRFHLSNFKTILPTHRVAQKVFPLIDITTVSMDLSINHAQQIPENSDEIRVRIAHELCDTDEIKQQIEEESLQMVIKTTYDVDTTIFATPEMETQLTFAKDRSVMASEYFSAKRSWTTSTESYFKERKIYRNSQFVAIVHFPLKPMKKLFLGATAVTEKAASITQDEISAVTTPEAKMLQQQKGTVKEFEQIRQQFGNVER
ncbi:unnamed protein product [Cercopithifilaria johnstoni]|uniref:Uncharacterized protein n=1 Tax=Cercopithifilaria johnstoni TaxID=2874296 RepID=A0A8J2LVG0_9BILA|nr:unnamed protein product [Cercopithifilaria johnstoni]